MAWLLCYVFVRNLLMWQIEFWSILCLSAHIKIWPYVNTSAFNVVNIYSTSYSLYVYFCSYASVRYIVWIKICHEIFSFSLSLPIYNTSEGCEIPHFYTKRLLVRLQNKVSLYILLRKCITIKMLQFIDYLCWGVLPITYGFNSLWPRNVIWRQRSGSTFAQVLACCLTAQSHYLSQCSLINGVPWHSLF